MHRDASCKRVPYHVWNRAKRKTRWQVLQRTSQSGIRGFRIDHLHNPVRCICLDDVRCDRKSAESEPVHKWKGMKMLSGSEMLFC